MFDVRTEPDALAELALFGRDPANYRTQRQVAAAGGTRPVCVDEATAAGFLAYLAQHGRTDRYRLDVRHSLAQWASALAGRDLRQFPHPDDSLRRCAPSMAELGQPGVVVV
jgi:hypothetical protein